MGIFVRWARLVSLLLLLLGARNAAGFPSSRLVYARGPGAEGCPEQAAVREAVAPAPVDQFLQSGNLISYFEGSIAWPRCGVTQRVSYWNRSCGEATQILLYATPSDNDIFDKDTGKETIPVTPAGPFPEGYGPQKFCYLREPRKFQEKCPAGYTCTAGGECNSLGAKPNLKVVTAIPPPRPAGG